MRFGGRSRSVRWSTDGPSGGAVPDSLLEPGAAPAASEPDHLVCSCQVVSSGELRAAIAEFSLTTVETDGCVDRVRRLPSGRGETPAHHVVFQPREVLPEGSRMKGRNLATGVAAAALAVGAYGVGVSQNAAPASAEKGSQINLWQTYQDVLTKARYISLSHVLTPTQPVWKGFGPSKFTPTVDPATGQAVHVRRERLRGDALRHLDRSVRHPARPARALGARVPGDRRAAGDVRRPAAAGRDLDRQAGQAEGRLPPAGE